MQLYHILPNTRFSVGDSTFKKLQSAVLASKSTLGKQLVTRLDVVKLAVCSLLNAVVHTGTSIGKFTIAYIQLPGHPIWGGIANRIALRESRAHFSFAIKSVAAAILVPLPALVSPNFAIRSYRWLALAPKEGFFTTMAHKLLRHPHARKTLFTVASITTALVVSYRCFSLVPSQDDRRLIIGGLVAATGLLSLVGCATCCRRTKPTKKQTTNKQTMKKVQPVSSSMPVDTTVALNTTESMETPQPRDKSKIESTLPEEISGSRRHSAAQTRTFNDLLSLYSRNPRNPPPTSDTAGDGDTAAKVEGVEADFGIYKMYNTRAGVRGRQPRRQTTTQTGTQAQQRKPTIATPLSLPPSPLPSTVPVAKDKKTSDLRALATLLNRGT